MKSDVVGLGQCCVDYLGIVEHYPGVDEKREVNNLTIQGGGPVATAMVTLSRLGVSTSFIGKISDDYFGNLIKESLIDENVNIDYIVVEKGKKSQLSFIAIEKETGKRTIFWSRATVTPLKPNEINKDLIRNARILHLDELMIESSLEAARCAKEVGVIVVVDAGSLREGSLGLVKMADYFITSEDFAKQYYKSHEPKKVAREMLKIGAKVVIVTLGGRGSVTVSKEDCFYQPAFKIKAVDTTGCGDVFHGAFIYGLLQNWDLKTSVRFASATAALKCRSIGGRAAIPNLKEVKDFLKSKSP
ncbi:MAG: carbohydrate kinase family protein [Candidatus Scalinduaceae bacterium]